MITKPGSYPKELVRMEMINLKQQKISLKSFRIYFREKIYKVGEIPGRFLNYLNGVQHGKNIDYEYSLGEGPIGITYQFKSYAQGKFVMWGEDTYILNADMKNGIGDNIFFA